MKRMRGKSLQGKPTQAPVSGKRDKRRGARETQDQFFGFPSEKIVTERGRAKFTKRQPTDSTRRLPIDAPKGTLKNKSTLSQEDQYLTDLNHVHSEKIAAKKNTELSKGVEDDQSKDFQRGPIICKRTWLRQVKVPTSDKRAVNRKNITSSLSKAGAVTGMRGNSASPRRTDVVRKENGVSERFPNRDCMPTSRNTIGRDEKDCMPTSRNTIGRDEKDFTSEYIKLQTLLENQIKSVPSQSWSVNADAIPSLRRSSTTIFSRKTYFKPPYKLRFHNREAGDLSAWGVQDLNMTEVGKVNIKAGEPAKQHTESNYPNELADNSKAKNSNVVIHQNIKMKLPAHRTKVSSLLPKRRFKTKQSRDKSRFYDSTESPTSQTFSSKRRSQTRQHTSKVESEETDLSMIPMKDSDTDESLLSSPSDESDKILTNLSKCSTPDSWDPYSVHAEVGMLECATMPREANFTIFQQSSGHCVYEHAQRITQRPVKTSELEPFVRIRLKNSKAEESPVKKTKTLKENLDISDSGDWSKFTPVCHIYNGSAPSQLSNANLASRSDDDSIKVININEPKFLKASDIAVVSELKDTSTWVTGHLGNHSHVSFTSTNVEELTLKSNTDEMPECIRVKSNRISLHIESTGTHMERNKKLYLESNSEKLPSTFNNVTESIDCVHISHSSSSHEISKTNRKSPKISYSFNKKEETKKSSLLKKHNWRCKQNLLTEKNTVDIIPPKSQLTQLSAVNAPESFTKRTCSQRRKQNRRNNFAKTINNRHKGFKEQSTYLRAYVLPKKERLNQSARSSQIQSVLKSKYGLIPTEPEKLTLQRGAAIHTNQKDLKQDIGLQCSRLSPQRVPNGEQQAIFSSTDFKKKTREFKRSTSYPAALREVPSKHSSENEIFEIPVMEQGIQKVETVVLTVTNVKTSTTNFLEHRPPDEISNRKYGHRFRIRVVVKPPCKRAAIDLAQEANLTIPVTRGEDERDHGVVKGQTPCSAKGAVDWNIEPCEIESSSTQFQSLQDFLPESQLKADPTDVVCDSKHTKNPTTGTGAEPSNASPCVEIPPSGVAQSENKKDSITKWKDVCAPSVKPRNTKHALAKMPCLPRYPRRHERQLKVKSAWEQIHSEITPIVRPILILMLLLWVIYLIIMTVFSLHTIQRQ